MWNSSSQGGFFVIAIMVIAGISVVQAGYWWETSIYCYDCNGWWNHCPEKDDGTIPIKKCVARAGTVPWCSKTVRTIAGENGAREITVQRECFTVYARDTRSDDCKREAFGTSTWNTRCECSSGYCNL